MPLMTDVALPPHRTVCHGCRATVHETVVIDDEQRMRPVIMPGDGTVMREVTPGVMVSQPCPICGDSDDPGWVLGFIPPA
jgi:hypothetical protein